MIRLPILKTDQNFGAKAVGWEIVRRKLELSLPNLPP